MLTSVAYLAETSTLELEFRNGAAYRYFAVPRVVFDDLLAAESKGAYFGQCIRDIYPNQRVARPS